MLHRCVYNLFFACGLCQPHQSSDMGIGEGPGMYLRTWNVPEDRIGPTIDLRRSSTTLGRGKVCCRRQSYANTLAQHSCLIPTCLSFLVFGQMGKAHHGPLG